VTYNKDQWIESFEGQLFFLRPHLTQRVLSSLGLTEWHQVGRGGADPIMAAKELSKLFDKGKTQ
jgi:hypothetical protein